MTAHPFITFTSASLSPSPIVIPENITIGEWGTVHNYFSNEVRMIVYIENLLVYLSVKIQGVNYMSSLYFSLNDKNISSNFISVKFSETIQISYIVKDSNFGFSRDVTFILITGNEIGNVCIVVQCKYAPVLIK